VNISLRNISFLIFFDCIYLFAASLPAILFNSTIYPFALSLPKPVLSLPKGGVDRVSRSCFDRLTANGLIINNMIFFRSPFDKLRANGKILNSTALP